MPSRSSRLAWLEPLDTDGPTFSLPPWKDFDMSGSMATYFPVALGGVCSAALVVGLGLGRPPLFTII